MFFSRILGSLFFLLANFSYFLLAADPPQTNVDTPQTASRISVLGTVYCDVCYANAFTKHSYFLPGADVHVQCKIKASPPGTTEQISFSVNKTTDRYGMYRLDIPSVDGVDCADDPTIQSFCQASLIGSAVPACNVPCTRATSSELTLKSKQTNLCTYSLGTLSYKPNARNVTLCGNTQLTEEKFANNANLFNSSKTFFPFFPPFVFPWPPFPQFPPLPPLPQLPPFPPFPFPTFPFPPSPPPLTFPFPFAPGQNPNPPSLTFPFPSFPPPPPTFNLSDPRTWIPYYPFLLPPPPPPPLPSPPAFNFWDPRTWIPRNPPSPPRSYLDSQHP